MKLRPFTFSVIAGGILTAGLLLAQTYPQWWLQRDVVPVQAPPVFGKAGHDPDTYDEWVADNYAAANLGQAKNLFTAAMNEMEAASAGSVGVTIPAMFSAFSYLPEDNYVPLTIGQLKALSAPFYDVMHEADFTVTLAGDTVVPDDTYPWTQDETTENLAIANLGQLKHVFSFSLDDWSDVFLNPPAVSMPIDQSYVYLAEPSVDAQYVVGATVALEAFAGFSGDSVSQVEFLVDSVVIASADTTAPYTLGWTATAADTYLLSVRATSTGGSVILSAERAIQVSVDLNSNGLSDTWEDGHAITSPTDDSDGDGLLASDEFEQQLSPNSKDHPAVQLSLFGINL